MSKNVDYIDNYVVVHFDNGKTLRLEHTKIDNFDMKASYNQIEYQNINYVIDTSKIVYIEEIKQDKIITTDDILRS